jgi:hypothetical protein
MENALMLPIVEQMAMMESGRCMVAYRGGELLLLFRVLWMLVQVGVGRGWLEFMNEKLR